MYKSENEFRKAKVANGKALKISRELAVVNKQTYLPYVATTLNNLAGLYSAKNDFKKSGAAYKEALKIYRELAALNPQTYLPNLAAVLNNLAVLYNGKSEFPKAEAAYEEALKIRKELADVNPKAHLPDVAMTTVNMSVFYLESIPNKEKSLALVKETIQATLPFLEILPAAANYTQTARQVVKDWGLDVELFFNEVASELNKQELPLNSTS